MKKILALSVLLALVGCADQNGHIFNPKLFGPDDASAVKTEEIQTVSDLKSVKITTDSFSEVSATYLNVNKTVPFSLSLTDSVMQLPSGKTLVKLFALPQLEFDQGIHVMSEAREFVVVPYMQFLDANFKPIDGEFSSTYNEKNDQFEIVAPVDDMAKSIRYVAVYSHQYEYGKQSPLYDAEQQYNKDNGVDTPAKPWLKTTHAPMGNLTIKIERIEGQ